MNGNKWEARREQSFFSPAPLAANPVRHGYYICVRAVHSESDEDNDDDDDDECGSSQDEHEMMNTDCVVS